MVKIKIELYCGGQPETIVVKVEKL